MAQHIFLRFQDDMMRRQCDSGVSKNPPAVRAAYFFFKILNTVHLFIQKFVQLFLEFRGSMKSLFRSLLSEFLFYLQ